MNAQLAVTTTVELISCLDLNVAIVYQHQLDFVLVMKIVLGGGLTLSFGMAWCNCDSAICDVHARRLIGKYFCVISTTTSNNA